ncbi:aminotransferase class V-fold PLP-dependent enzyme [Candidatus Palauibacter sp.]|uniref:aminotransferase class V-fold PLP-dependent enzyme n=1 Tax=Candidatus Palauibacter sp. TaxID=3101350 RepID=UPI003B0222AE
MIDAPHLGTESLDRREWLRLGAAGAAALGLPACAAWNEGDESSDAPPPLQAPAGVEDAEWEGVRAHFLVEPGVAYLNNASIGMPPRQVVDAVAAGYRAMAELPARGRSDLSARIAERVVPGLARLFSIETDELTLTRNASEALHLQSVGVAMGPGDEVLITTQEHPAGRRPWEFRQAREGIRVNEVFIPSPLPDDEEILSRFADAITPRTRAVAFCHVTRGGHRYPVQAICRLARDRGLVSLVDGAQAVGQFAIDVTELGCDAYSVSLHKWMLAPAGTGFLFVRRDARDRIRTAFAPDATPGRPQFDPPGTTAFPVRAAIGSAVDFVATLGLEAVEARCRFLSDYLKARLADLPGVTPLSGARALSAPGSTIFEKEGLDAVAAVEAIETLASAHIDEHQRDGHNAIRVSTHVYNTTAQVDRFVEALARTTG